MTLSPLETFLASLVSHRLATEQNLHNWSAQFKQNSRDLLRFLIAHYPLHRHEFGMLWGDATGFTYVDPTTTLVQAELLQKMPKTFLREHQVVPLTELNGVATLAMFTPDDTDLIQQCENFMNCFISPVFAFPDQIETALELASVTTLATSKLLQQVQPKTDGMAGVSHIAAELLQANDQIMVDFTRDLLLLAVKNRASDIHIEPGEEEIRVRFRIDGVLQDFFTLDLGLKSHLTNHLKVLAACDIGESRKPQDGRISLNLPDRCVDFRFACMPVVYGEKLVLRILGSGSHSRNVPELEELDFSKAALDGVKRIMGTPNGVFFLTGPTGSGKTTTLYAVLKRLNQPGINIVTIEDPVEYRLPGINQSQINSAAGDTFATSLRAILRQDPDVILIGEIRDLETAKTAATAALTGHFVLTTLHTNNALQAVTRVIEIGVEPFLVAPSIIAVMAQRLVRRLCEQCKEDYALTPAEIERLFTWDGQTPVTFCRARGCEQCNYTGYWGRIAIHELFVIDDEMRSLIARNASILDIQEFAYRKGFTSLRYDGIKKVLRGLTTIEEIERVTIESA